MQHLTLKIYMSNVETRPREQFDPKSIKAVKVGNNREIYQARKKLEKEGFSWSEK
ncbi:hypothetical protein ES705_40663 [subsurface metagenome]